MPNSKQKTRDRILFILKTRGPQTTGELARRLDRTPMGIRIHLKALTEARLVEFSEEPGEVGRPARLWHLTEEARDQFPDGHADLTVDLIEQVRAVFGERGLDRVIEHRAETVLESYRQVVPGKEAPLEKRVAALARERSREGYMASWRKAADGSLHLVENHCPICAAAELCLGLCRTELELFRSLLGPGVGVERTEHLLDGARRCAYVIRSV